MGFFKTVGKIAGAVGRGAKEIISNPTPTTVARVAKETYNEAKSYIAEAREERRIIREEAEAKIKKDLSKTKENTDRNADLNAEQFANEFDEEFDIDTANANEVRKLQHMLDGYQATFQADAERIEDSIISYSQDSIEETVKSFEEINDMQFGNSPMNLNIKSLQNAISRVNRQVKGCITGEIRKNLSIDNTNCTDILKMSGKKARKQAMKDFQNSIFADAVGELWEQIESTITVNSENIFQQIENRLEIIEANEQNDIKTMQEIEKTKSLGEEALQEKQNEMKNKIAICDFCLGLLD